MEEKKNAAVEDDKLINDILNIDSMVFPKHLQGTFEEVKSRFLVNRDMFILLHDEDKLIGYMCFFPVKDELYGEILKGEKLFDSDIPANLLEQYNEFNTYKMFVISAAIIPEYQGKGLSKQLIKGFYKHLLEKKEKNILFSAALSVAVTGGGEHLLNLMKFQKVKVLPTGHALYERIIDDTYYSFLESELS